MAMLRNIRNMMKAGISEKHHQWVIGKLTDEGAVTHSKQFPFRFFSAYTVLKELEDDYNKHRKCITQCLSNNVDEHYLNVWVNMIYRFFKKFNRLLPSIK